MSDKEKLTAEAKTNITPSASKALDRIAEERGEGVKRSDVLREAIRDFIAKNPPKKN